MSWHNPLSLAIRKFQEGAESSQRRKRGRSNIADDAARLMNTESIAPEALAVIVMHESLSMLMQCLNGVPLSRAAMSIGEAVRAEINLAAMKKHKQAAANAEAKQVKRNKERVSMDDVGAPLDSGAAGAEGIMRTTAIPKRKRSGAAEFGEGTAPDPERKARKSVRRNQKKQALYETMSLAPGRSVSAINHAAMQGDFAAAKWSKREVMLVGSTLIDMLLRHAHVSVGEEGAVSVPTGSSTSKRSTKSQPKPVPAFRHYLERNEKAMKDVGILTMTEPVVRLLFEDEDELREIIEPKQQPMVVRPRPWISPRRGAYLSVPTDLVRARPSKALDDALAAADLQGVFEGLNALGDTAWCVNRRVLGIAETLWSNGGGKAGLVSRHDVRVPERSDYVDSARAVRVLRKLRAAKQERPSKRAADDHDSLATDEGSREDAGLDHTPASLASGSTSTEDGPDAETVEVLAALRKYRRERRKALKTNRELLSLRANTGYQLDQAATFRDTERIYLPHNVDFRGRAYPIPSYLQHMGADLMRAMLTFADTPGVELGERGVYWLKVHLANLLGADKLSFDERIAYAEESLPRALATARDPFGDSNLEWWTSQEDPFQLLATCYEFGSGMGRYGNEASLRAFHSSLPVSMDGSCNGLQHYAALGRDVEGGTSVNLTPNSRPQDVYTGVAERVQRRVAEAAANGDEIAKLLENKVTRKVIKQTVMTSVYGVTVIGARAQIENRLRELGGIPDEQMFDASIKLAKWTLSSLGDMFSGATRTMDWLSASAKSVSRSGAEVQWLTPLGLPVIQPYRKRDVHVIKTVVQRVKVDTGGDHMPVSTVRQQSAFAPNFVHSIDSSHMLLSAVACRQAGLTFAAVHDSFWTHAATVDEMNRILRRQFVDLHRRELLVELRDSFRLRHPNVQLPPLPERGDLDLDLVLEAPYFFS